MNWSIFLTIMNDKKHFRVPIVVVIVIVCFVAIVAFFVGSQINGNKDPILALEEAVSEYPRSTYGEPAQWFMMKSLVGWERMMFIFGYADDKEVCEHLAEVASKESPDREFRCEDAN